MFLSVPYGYLSHFTVSLSAVLCVTFGALSILGRAEKCVLTCQAKYSKTPYVMQIGSNQKHNEFGMCQPSVKHIGQQFASRYHLFQGRYY